MRQIRKTMESDRFRVIPIDAVSVVELLLPEFIDSDEFDRINESLLESMGDRASGRWVIDLTNVSYMGSSALGLLVNFRQKVKKAGGHLVVCGLSKRLLQIFHTCCMERLFTIVKTRDEAIHHA